MSVPQRPLYKIGDYVVVHAIVKPVWTNSQAGRRENRRTLERTSITHNPIGIIVGMRRLQEGNLENVTVRFTSDYEPPEEVEYFNPSRTHRVYLVRFGMYNRPVYVPLGGFTKLDKLPKEYKFPLLYQGLWTEKDRKDLSRESQHWPRDNSGKWIKTGKYKEKKNFQILEKK